MADNKNMELNDEMMAKASGGVDCQVKLTHFYT